MGEGGHADHPYDPQQRDHQEPQDLSFKAWGEQMVGNQVEKIFPISLEISQIFYISNNVPN